MGATVCELPGRSLVRSLRHRTKEYCGTVRPDVCHSHLPPAGGRGTIERHGQHFWRNGHSVRIMVFDDSSPANQEKYFSLVQQTCAHNDMYDVGPREEEQFLAYLNSRLREARLGGLMRDLFRPSDGANRNWTLTYTLGDLMASSDDDMRPYALMEGSPESLQAGELSRGRLYKAGKDQVVHKAFDIRASREDVLGRPVSEIPENYERGELLIDTAMDLETNATKGLSVENSVMLEHGPVPEGAIVKIAQTFRSGTNDI